MKWSHAAVSPSRLWESPARLGQGRGSAQSRPRLGNCRGLLRSQILLVVNLLLRPSDSAMVKSNEESQQGVTTESGGQPYVCRST